MGVAVPEDNICDLAVNLALSSGFAVFPCRADKSPACPHGFKDASCDPAVIRALFQRYPGQLIGIATGTVSGIWVIDVDSARYESACDWFHDNHHRLLPTRVYRTRSGGLHLAFRNGGETGNSASRLAGGIDVRGNGGYVIAWFLHGCELLDPSPPAPWPRWVARRLAPPKPGHRIFKPPTDFPRALTGVVNRLASAVEGERNAILFWAACRFVEHGESRGNAESDLLPVCRALALPDWEARRTIASAFRYGRRHS